MQQVDYINYLFTVQINKHMYNNFKLMEYLYSITNPNLYTIRKTIYICTDIYTCVNEFTIFFLVGRYL